ncbi:MAG: hypothetical protein MZV64_10605 [Ignavibacteriales bacterium]|nr:hypothetical protein [Ignavibacteriales bacterium]
MALSGRAAPRSLGTAALTWRRSIIPGWPKWAGCHPRGGCPSSSTRGIVNPRFRGLRRSSRILCFLKRIGPLRSLLAPGTPLALSGAKGDPE